MFRKTFILFLAAFALSGCDALIDALNQAAAQPRFAFVTQRLDPGTDPDDFDDQVVTEVFVATISEGTDPTAPSRSIPFASDVLFENVSFIDVQKLVWHPGGDHLALEIYEDIAGFEFDIWVAIYTRGLSRQFLASDDNMAGDASNICPSNVFFPNGFEGFVADEIALGALPPGTTAGVNWGSGNVLAGTFHGWLTPNRFVSSILNDPEVFLTRPDGTVTGPFGEASPAIWGAEQEVYLIYERRGTRWVEVECLDDLPVIPTRPAASRAMAIDGSGDVTLDGSVLLGLTGTAAVNAPGSTIQLDGPYP
ncbi:MAG: hypothetical protein AAGF88_07595 [Pseudomonadota bacterium]